MILLILASSIALFSQPLFMRKWDGRVGREMEELQEGERMQSMLAGECQQTLWFVSN